MSDQESLPHYKSSSGPLKYNHRKTSQFKKLYDNLPAVVQKCAKDKFELLKDNPNHASLRFKKLKGYDDYWSVRVNNAYRAIAYKDEIGFVWDIIAKRDEVYKLLQHIS